MNENMLRKIKVFYNGHNFIFTSEDFETTLEIISMGNSKIYESGLICVEDIVLRHKKYFYRGDFRFHFLDRKPNYDFEIHLSQNINY